MRAWIHAFTAILSARLRRTNSAGNGRVLKLATDCLRVDSTGVMLIGQSRLPEGALLEIKWPAPQQLLGIGVGVAARGGIGQRRVRIRPFPGRPGIFCVADSGRDACERLPGRSGLLRGRCPLRASSRAAASAPGRPLRAGEGGRWACRPRERRSGTEPHPRRTPDRRWR